MGRRLNSVTLVGYVGNEIELIETSTGKKVLNISLSENITSGSKENQKTRTIWHKIVVWEKDAEHHAKFIKKGDKLTIIEGNLDYESRDIGGINVSQAFIVNPIISYAKNSLNIDLGGEKLSFK